MRNVVATVICIIGGDSPESAYDARRSEKNVTAIICDHPSTTVEKHACTERARIIFATERTRTIIATERVRIIFATERTRMNTD